MLIPLTSIVRPGSSVRKSDTPPTMSVVRSLGAAAASAARGGGWGSIRDPAAAATAPALSPPSTARRVNVRAGRPHESLCAIPPSRRKTRRALLRRAGYEAPTELPRGGGGLRPPAAASHEAERQGNGSAPDAFGHRVIFQ